MDVVLYARSGCHLCDQVELTLLDFRKRYCFSLDIVDIDQSMELSDLYNETIPLICINEKIVAKSPINLVKLEKIFRSIEGSF